jgi:hypothetical protein
MVDRILWVVVLKIPQLVFDFLFFMSYAFIMGFTPYTYNLIPPESSEGGLSAVEESMSAVREQWDAEKEKRIELLGSGPVLRNVGAAADCHCACHPTLADTGLHGGGVSCPCQLTKEERKTLVKKAFAAISKSEDPLSSEKHQEFLRELSDMLDADIWEAGGAAPYVVRGVVDGRFFYLRERHDRWRVEIAPDDDPLLDIWANSLPLEVNRVVVAEGSASTLYNGDKTNPVRVAVEAVRLFLDRRACEHEGVLRFCPHCGVQADEIDEWKNF